MMEWSKKKIIHWRIGQKKCWMVFCHAQAFFHSIFFTQMFQITNVWPGHPWWSLVLFCFSLYRHLLNLFILKWSKMKLNFKFRLNCIHFNQFQYTFWYWEKRFEWKLMHRNIEANVMRAYSLPTMIGRCWLLFTNIILHLELNSQKIVDSVQGAECRVQETCMTHDSLWPNAMQCKIMHCGCCWCYGCLCTKQIQKWSPVQSLTE